MAVPFIMFLTLELETTNGLGKEKMHFLRRPTYEASLTVRRVNDLLSMCFDRYISGSITRNRRVFSHVPKTFTRLLSGSPRGTAGLAMARVCLWLHVINRPHYLNAAVAYHRPVAIAHYHSRGVSDLFASSVSYKLCSEYVTVGNPGSVRNDFVQ